MASLVDLKVGQVDIHKPAAPKEDELRVSTQSASFLERLISILTTGMFLYFVDFTVVITGCKIAHTRSPFRRRIASYGLFTSGRYFIQLLSTHGHVESKRFHVITSWRMR